MSLPEMVNNTGGAQQTISPMRHHLGVSGNNLSMGMMMGSGSGMGIPQSIGAGSGSGSGSGIPIAVANFHFRVSGNPQIHRKTGVR